MIDFADDLASVFFGPDFAVPFTRQRAGVADVTVMLIVGTTDSEVLDARALAASRTARFAAGQDVRTGDRLVLEIATPDMPVGTTLRVLDVPQRVNDGLEMEALLGSAAA
jgi:hypothetical protein